MVITITLFLGSILQLGVTQNQTQLSLGLPRGDRAHLYIVQEFTSTVKNNINNNM